MTVKYVGVTGPRGQINETRETLEIVLDIMSTCFQQHGLFLVATSVLLLYFIIVLHHFARRIDTFSFQFGISQFISSPSY